MVTARRRDLIGALSETVLGRPLSPVEHTAIDIALAATVAASQTPILPMVVERILHPDTDADPRLAEDGRIVGHALRRLVAGDLAGIFDGPSTVAFDPDLPMVSLDLSRVAENNALISVLMTCASAWMESALLDPNGGQRWVIYDEAWQLMQHPALLRRMDAHWRLARHLRDREHADLPQAQRPGQRGRPGHRRARPGGVAVGERRDPDHLPPGVRPARLHRGDAEPDRDRAEDAPASSAPDRACWRIKDRSFVVQHQLHPAELGVFDTTARMRTS